MIRKIRNPFSAEGNKCFGCGPKNPVGLKLDFKETDNEVIAVWKPDINYQGYFDVLHGGIIATLLDEVAAWFVYVKLETAGVTSELKVKYIKPVHLSKGDITVKASLVEKSGHNASIKCHLYDGTEKLCSEADAEFFVFPSEVAARKFMYPGISAFHGEN